MLLKNKKTGEIGYLRSINWNETAFIIMDKDGIQLAKYNSLAELSAEWGDVPEEPKEYWFVADNGLILTHTDGGGSWTRKFRKEIGNYFSSREEAEKAVEELRAFKRLKDKGFRFKKWESYEETSGLSFSDRHIVNSYTAIFDFNKPCRKYEIEDKVKDDLDLLFSQEAKND